MNLTPKMQRFVLHWGEMGPKWGINRTVAQIHALLYLSPEALNADEIAKTLSVARSNVSNSLKELQTWGLIRSIQRLGDRKDYFECTTSDAWEMLRVILEERKRREIDPAIEALRECTKLSASGEIDAHVSQRIGSMLEVFESLNDMCNQVNVVPPAKISRLVAKVRKSIGKV